MAFNARWALEDLAMELKRPVPDLIFDLQSDFSEMVRTCPAYRLGVEGSGNYFRLADAEGTTQTPCALAGLYAMFTPHGVVYFGEATDLCRRQLRDPDNTADSGKVFTNQGRAVLKLLLDRRWAERLGLEHLLVQLYPADCRLATRKDRTFDECYCVSRFSKALQGALSLFVSKYHSAMITRAAVDRLIVAPG